MATSLLSSCVLFFLSVLAAHAQYYPEPQQDQQQQYYPPPQQQYYPSPYETQPYPPNPFPAAPPGGDYGRAIPPPPPQGGFVLPLPVPQWLQDQAQAGDNQRSLTPPSIKFKIGIVADKLKPATNKDEDTGKYKSNLREGSLYLTNNKTDPTHPKITVEFEEREGVFPLESGINFGGKGFQLSTLNTFNEKLFSCDSKTGIVYELKKIEAQGDDDGVILLPIRGNQHDVDERQGRDYSQVDGSGPRFEGGTGVEDGKKYKYVAQPWVILSNEKSNKPFKCEWGIVRENKLWIGSSGSLVYKNKPSQQGNRQQDESSGESFDETASRSNKAPEFSKERQFVKRIDGNGQVETFDFSKHYEEIAKAYEVELRQGHVIHEAAEWNDVTQKWLFIPRRVTKEKKDKGTWDSISTNRGVVSDDPFEQLNIVEFGNLTETSGVVGLRYIPGTNDRFILALKTGRDEEGNQVSKLAVYDETGYELMPETTVAHGSYSAVEFL